MTLVTDTAPREASWSRRIGWWMSDIVLWLGLIGFICLGIFGWQKAHEPQRLSLDFNDAIELSEGSQVRLMGVEVGMVKKLRIDQDHVNIQVEMERNSPVIPDGSLITIDFNGLAGAKSIEILPPRHPKPGSPMRLRQPFRMGDVQMASLLTAEALQAGSENTSRLIDANAKDSKRLLHMTLQGTANGVVFLRQTQDSLDQAEKTLPDTLNDVNQALGTFNHSLKTVSPKHAMGQRQSRRLLRQTQHMLHQLRQSRQQLNQSGHWLVYQHPYVSGSLSQHGTQLARQSNQFQQGVAQWAGTLHSAASMTAEWPNRLQGAQAHAQVLRRQMEQLNTRFSVSPTP